jgi:hypothetical protein
VGDFWLDKAKESLRKSVSWDSDIRLAELELAERTAKALERIAAALERPEEDDDAHA